MEKARQEKKGIKKKTLLYRNLIRILCLVFTHLLNKQSLFAHLFYYIYTFFLSVYFTQYTNRRTMLNKYDTYNEIVKIFFLFWFLFAVG